MGKNKKRKNQEDIDKIKFLIENSRIALANNLSSFDTNNSKAGIYISISAFSVPLFLNIFANSNICLIWTIYLFVPIFLNIIGLYFFITALKTKKVDNGIKVDKYDELINKSEFENLIFEIGVNRDSIRYNLPILKNQERKLHSGLQFTLVGLLSFTILYLIHLTT